MLLDCEFTPDGGAKWDVSIGLAGATEPFVGESLPLLSLLLMFIEVLFSSLPSISAVVLKVSLCCRGGGGRCCGCTRLLLGARL